MKDLVWFKCVRSDVSVFIVVMFVRLCLQSMNNGHLPRVELVMLFDASFVDLCEIMLWWVEMSSISMCHFYFMMNVMWNRFISLL